MNRRDFMALLGAAVAWSLAAQAQQPPVPVIGFLNPASPGAYAPFATAFRRGLREAGYVEGKNVAIEYRWAEGQYDQLPDLAADLVRRHVAVIAATGGDISALAAKAATATIPIVFDTGSDPVMIGLVASVNRPGGNVTGVTILTLELVPKRIELLRQVVPNVAVIGFLVNPIRPSAEAETKDAQAAGRALGVEIVVVSAGNQRDLDLAFGTLSQHHAGALLINGDNFFVSHRDQIATLAARYAIPTIYADRMHVAAGGLISYGTSVEDAYSRVGVYTGKILKGEKPADLPVEQLSKIELVINAKTAKTLGLEIPPRLLSRADEVIE